MFLYKYGAFILWFIIVLTFFISKDIWIGISILLICLATGITYADYYTGYIQHKQQKIFLTENDISIFVIAISLWLHSIFISAVIIAIFGIFHIIRHNNIEKLRLMKNRAKFRGKHFTDKLMKKR